MATDDPNDEHTGPRAFETLRRLERRLDEASEAAERLIGEAASEAAAKAASAARGRRPPPAGWQVPEDSSEERDSDAELLAQVVQSFRDLIPPELQRRLAEALRELLLAVRALIDWYLERLERRRAEPAEIKDIPIL